MTLLADEPHALYRFYGAGGTLLYIGITNSIPTRLKKHNADKPWWTGVAQVRIEHYPNRTAVLEAERRAIIAEKPLYNVQHNQAGAWPAVETVAVVSDELVAVCMGCHMRISDDEGGTLHIYQPGVSLYQKWEKERSSIDTWDLVDLVAAEPEFPRWLVHCDSCNPHWRSRYGDGSSVCTGCYAISVDQVRTWSELTWWTSHLAEKAWLHHTDWFDFLRNIATGAAGAGFVGAKGQA